MPQLETVNLGTSDLKVSRVAFGCCPMGGHGWGETHEEDFVNAVHHAMDVGINFFDTADIYGLGVSETILGKALVGRRASAIIASKFGVRRNSQGTYIDNSPEWIEQALDESLRRLKTDCIDLYQLHYWDGVTPLEAVFSTLERLKSQGKIRFFGTTNILDGKLLQNTAYLQASFSLEYSLVNRKHHALIAELTRRTPMTFLSWGTLGQGILSGKYTRDSIFSKEDRRSRNTYVNFHGAKWEENLRLLEGLREIQKVFYPDKSLGQLSLRWVLDRFPKSVTLTGIKNISQLTENGGALGWHLREEDLVQIEGMSGGREVISNLLSESSRDSLQQQV